jgi:hypothetical protein
MVVYGSLEMSQAGSSRLIRPQRDEPVFPRVCALDDASINRCRRLYRRRRHLIDGLRVGPGRQQHLPQARGLKVAYPWLQHPPLMCPRAVSSLRCSNGSLPDGVWLLAMSRIILSFTRKWTSCKGGSLRCSGQRAFQSSSLPNSIVISPNTALHLPKHLSFDSASHNLLIRHLWHLLCVGSSIFAGKQYTRSRLKWVPHPPASARLSRGRVWSAKLSLPLTSQQSLCRYIYLPQHPPWCCTSTRPLHQPFKHIGAGTPPLPFNHHSRRSPRVRLAVLHVTTPSLPLRIERVGPANTREHRTRLL